MKLLGSVWILGFIGACINALAFMFAMSAIPEIAKTIKHEVKASGEAQGKSVFWSFRTKEIENLSESLKSELKIMIEKEKVLQKEQARMDAQKNEINKLKKEVELLSEELDTRIILIEKSELKNLKTLAMAYSNMAPEDAIKILDGMNDLLTIKILALMKPDFMGAIFQQMSLSDDPRLLKKAAYLSERLRLYSVEKDPNKK